MHASEFKTRLVAHRGYRQHFPENTLLALKQAVALGVSHLEFDIQLTADSVPVLYHDESMRRTSGVNSLITGIDSAHLPRFNAAERKRLGYRFMQEPIPTLAEVVAWASTQPQLTLYVEVKEESIARFGIDHVIQAVMPVLQPLDGRAVVISFDVAFMTAVRDHWSRTGLVLRAWPPSHSLLGRVKPDLLFVNLRRVSFGQRLDRCGLPVIVYEIDSLRRAQRWLRRGAALLESYSSGTLIDAWQKRHG